MAAIIVVRRRLHGRRRTEGFIVLHLLLNIGQRHLFHRPPTYFIGRGFVMSNFFVCSAFTFSQMLSNQLFFVSTTCLFVSSTNISNSMALNFALHLRLLWSAQCSMAETSKAHKTLLNTSAYTMFAPVIIDAIIFSRSPAKRPPIKCAICNNAHMQFSTLYLGPGP